MYCDRERRLQQNLLGGQKDSPVRSDLLCIYNIQEQHAVED